MVEKNVRQQQSKQQDHAVARALIIDEFGELHRQIQLWQPSIRREQELRRIIENWFALADPAAGDVLDGELYRVIIGPRANHRYIDCRRLYQTIGEDYWLNASYPLRVFDTLRIDNAAGLTREERNGNRTVTPVPLVVGAAAGAAAPKKKPAPNKTGSSSSRKK